jgi:hypothetical protein
MKFHWAGQLWMGVALAVLTGMAMPVFAEAPRLAEAVFYVS